MFLKVTGAVCGKHPACGPLQLPLSPSLGIKGVIEKNLEALMEDTAFASSVGGRNETPTSPHVIGFKGRPGPHSDRTFAWAESALA